MRASLPNLGLLHTTRHRRAGRLGAIALAAGLGLGATPMALLTAGPAAAAGPVATVTGVMPISGSNTGFMVSGTNLGSTGITAVNVGSIAATSVAVNANGSSLTATAPANPNAGVGSQFGSTYDVTVNNGNGSGFSASNKNDQYTYPYDSNTCGASANATCASAITAQEIAPLVGTTMTAPTTVDVPVNAHILL